MLRRVEAESKPSLLDALGLARSEPVVPVVPDVELETAPLPHDHPKWAQDTVAISQRARELLARIKPIVVSIITFWDHRVRSIFVNDRTLNVDPSGSYRVD